jgi:two-component system cell cycle sensor histidine kinase/response regulator CckA
MSDGLGLSIAFSIISRHGGRIEVDSEEGKGTTFTIILPVSFEIKKDEKKSIQTREVKTANILVIDDEEMVRNILGSLLIQGGHNVYKASSGKEGLDIFDNEAIDLVFTDVGMPGMSGWEVAKSIKAKDPSIPVALITGWGIQIDYEKMKLDLT